MTNVERLRAERAMDPADPEDSVELAVKRMNGEA